MLITGSNSVKVKIVGQYDNEKSESFSHKVADSLFELGVYKYLKHGDFIPVNTRRYLNVDFDVFLNVIDVLTL